MIRRWHPTLPAWLALAAAGCQTPAPRPEYDAVTRVLRNAADRPPHTISPDEPMAAALDPPRSPPQLAGPQPVDVYIHHALAENRMVQAARFNALALSERIPQVTALDDPIVSNTIFPSAEYGLQTSDGFMPWNLLVAQQFPWFGTLGLRGLAAEQDVQVALAELCTAQLDVVESVKRAYADLYLAERSGQILEDNQALMQDFLEIARVRYATGQASQQDVLAAEVTLADLAREVLTIRQGLDEARADLAQQLHISPEADLRTVDFLPIGEVPAQIDRLYRLAAAARPELRGRLAAVARDATAVELARKRYYPDVTVGFNYMLMTTQGAVSPFAMGNDGLGMFVGLNLPIYRGKLDAGVREAQARAVADAKLYEAERDGVYRQLKELLTRSNSQREILDLFRSNILPRAREALEVVSADYQTGDADFQTLLTAWREVLQIELQAVQIEATLAQSLASLERAVGVQLNEHPPATLPGPANDTVPPPPAADTPAPFGPSTPTDHDAELDARFQGD